LYLRVSKPGRLCTGVIELNDLGIALLSAAEVVVQPIHGYGVGRVRLPTWQKDWRSNHLSKNIPPFRAPSQLKADRNWNGKLLCAQAVGFTLQNRLPAQIIDLPLA
jgi:hypothetical protein